MYVSHSTYLDALLLLLGDNSDRSKALVKDFIAVCEKDDKRKTIVTADDDLIDMYKDLIKTVLVENISVENKGASKILLLKVKTNEVLKSHPVIRDILTDILTWSEEESPITASQIDSYIKKIRNQLILAEIEEQNRKVFARTKQISEIKDADDLEYELLKLKSMLDDSLKAVERRQKVSDATASETYVSLSDPDSITRALNIFVDRNVRGVIKTGLQGMNKSLGSRGGFGRGETAVFAACSHNYKSGMLVSIMIWTIIYNKVIVEPGKKALVYFVSLENEVNQNLMDVFKILYGMVEKVAVDPTKYTPEYMTEWLIKYFSQFEVELIIDRYQPHEFTFNKFMQRYNSFVELNYEVVLFDLDYMSEARGVDPGDTVSSQGRIQMIAENYLKFTNHAKACGYLLTTGHQLTKKADETAAQYRYGVKRFNPSMMADSSDVLRIVDILYFIHLETSPISGIKFLTAVIRKNRGCKDTPEKDKFFAYPFTEFGIEDDINGEPKYVIDIDAMDAEHGDGDGNLLESAMF